MDAPPRPEPALSESLGLTRYTFTKGKLGLLASAVLMVLAGGVLSLSEQPAPQTAQATPSPAQPSVTPISGAGLPALPGEALAPGADALTPGADALTPGADALTPTGFTDTRRVPFTSPSPTSSGGVEVAPPPPLPAETAGGEADRQPLPEPIGWSGPLTRGGFGLAIGFLIGFAVRAFVRLAGVIAGFYVLSLTVLAHAGWIEVHWEVIEAQVVPALGSLGAEFQSFRAFLAGSLPTAGLATVGLASGLKKN